MDEVIKDFKNVHGEIYDYSLVPGDYNTADEEINIICKEHGELLKSQQSPDGEGLPKMQREEEKGELGES